MFCTRKEYDFRGAVGVFLTMILRVISLALLLAVSLPTFSGLQVLGTSSTQSSSIDTLAGKNAILNSTQGLYYGLSGVLQQEATSPELAATSNGAITPTYVPNSNLDGTSIVAPDVTVNVDKAGAPQNEPATAVDPNNPNRIVAGANDYVTVTWNCSIGPTPCSTFGNAYSGTYFSNDSGKTWCCTSTDPQHLGTLVPGVERLTGGPYDMGGDPSLAFDNAGNVYFAGLGFDALTPPNTITVSRGTFDSSGMLRWGAPTFLSATTSHSILNDKPWVSVDVHPTSKFYNRLYVSWTRFIFNPRTFTFVNSPIMLAYSNDGGATFSTPQSIVQNLIYGTGSHIVIGSDGTVYVFWVASTRLATYNSVYVVKSADGGVTWTAPTAVSTLVNIAHPSDTVFRNGSVFPWADIAPDGTLYVVFQSEERDTASSYTIDPTCAYFISGFASVYANCHAAAFWTKSSDGGGTWTMPKPIFPTLDSSSRAPIGYPQTQLDGSTMNAPPARRVDTFFSSVAISPSGHVYMSAYAADIVSPWRTCVSFESSVNCLQLGNYIDNARLDYVVTDLTTGTTRIVTTQPINTRYQFRGGFFFGDYTDLTTGADNSFHATWTDTNNVQTIVWWLGEQYVPTPEHQQDIATVSGSF